MIKFTTKKKRRKEWVKLCQQKAERLLKEQKSFYGPDGHMKAFSLTKNGKT